MYPSMAIDGTPEHPEKEHLNHYHTYAEERGYNKHMPKNKEEFLNYTLYMNMHQKNF